MAAQSGGPRVSVRGRVIRRITEAGVGPVGVPIAKRRKGFARIERTPRPMGFSYTRRQLGGVPAIVATPHGPPTDLHILYLHGGGYIMGSAGTHIAGAARLAKVAGATITAIDYRLAPEHPYPAAVDDAVAAYRALITEVDPSTIAIAGDSAGGGLTVAALCRLREAGDPLPSCAYLLSPFTDLTASGESVTTNAANDRICRADLMAELIPMYLGNSPADDPGPSPLFADLRGLPPMLVQVGGHEVLLSDSTRLAERARAAGVEVELEVGPGLWHVFQMTAPYVPEANAAFARAAAFLRAHTRSDAPGLDQRSSRS